MESEKYQNFILKHGIPVSHLNPGSDEYALNINYAYDALQILRRENIGIVGGDIFSTTKNGTLKNAYQLWGEEFHTLNWSFNDIPNKEKSVFVKMSHDYAYKCIELANQYAKQLGQPLYVTLII